MPRPLIRLLRLFATVVALVQGAVPAAASVAEGVLADRGSKNPALVHIEDGRQGTCGYAHPGDCGVCGCVATFPLLADLRGPVVAAPLRLVPPGEEPPGHHGGGWSSPHARAPPRA